MSEVVTGSTEPTVAQLENEGDVAADYLEELLDIADIDGDLNLDVRQGRAYVSVEAEGDGLALLSAPDTVRRRHTASTLPLRPDRTRFRRPLPKGLIGGS